MTAKTERGGLQGDVLLVVLDMTEAERARLFLQAAALVLAKDDRPVMARLRSAGRLARLALCAWLRGNMPDVPRERLGAWLLLALAAGVAALGGKAWTPAVCFLCVSSLAVVNLPGWVETARGLGSGWPKR